MVDVVVGVDVPIKLIVEPAVADVVIVLVNVGDEVSNVCLL
jgi:hypothetical protein